MSEGVLIDKPRPLQPLTGIGAKFGRGRSIIRGGQCFSVSPPRLEDWRGRNAGRGGVLVTLILSLHYVLQRPNMCTLRYFQNYLVYFFRFIECWSACQTIPISSTLILLRVTKCNYIFYLLYGFYLIYFFRFIECQCLSKVEPPIYNTGITFLSLCYVLQRTNICILRYAEFI